MTSTTFEALDSRVNQKDVSARWGLPNWYSPLMTSLVVEVFLLIALGGFVRIMNAGLACPDWPLCFGDFIPDYHPQVYFEFIHRAMAGLVSITTAILTLYMALSRAPRSIKLTMFGALVLLLAQVIFGGLTVLWALRAGVVATHLGMGTAFFGVLLMLSLYVKPIAAGPVISKRYVRGLVIAMTAFVYGQILMGGLVASNYAGLVCIDFPKCQGSWIPTLQGPVGLQVLHRFGAYTIFLITFFGWQLVRRGTEDSRVRRLAGAMFACVCLQVCLGIANVLLLTPAIIGVAHLATATFILSLGVRLIYLTRPTPLSA